MARCVIYIITFFTFCILNANLFAQHVLYGKVVALHDGDTFTILDNDKIQYKIRMDGIDAPELGQDYSKASKKFLSDLIYMQTVKITYRKKDKYGRYIATVLLDNENINLKMIANGMAWHYTKYNKDATYIDAEKYAKAQKKGLWSLNGAIAPWLYRESRKHGEKQFFNKS